MASGAFASAGLVRQGRGQLILEIDIRQLLPCAVAHDKANVVGVLQSSIVVGSDEWRAFDLDRDQ